jgi:hypothetical protein
MRNFYKKEEYVYKDANIRLSQKAMSDFLYASLMCQASITTSWCLCYEYSRKQNSYNNADFKVYIHPNEIEQFEIISGTKLKEPIKLMINYNKNEKN